MTVDITWLVGLGFILLAAVLCRKDKTLLWTFGFGAVFYLLGWLHASI